MDFHFIRWSENDAAELRALLGADAAAEAPRAAPTPVGLDAFRRDRPPPRLARCALTRRAEPAAPFERTRAR